ncbi:MAG: hypothetical protein ACLVBQ_05995 [Ruminococcus callidus]
MQTPYKIKLPACTRKHLNITLPIPARATIGVGKPQADSECNERIPPDGFDMAALENCCPQASSRGDVGVLPTYFKEVYSVLTITPKMNKPHREIKVDFGLYTKSCGFSVAGITLCHEIFRFFSVLQPETLLRVAFVNF